MWGWYANENHVKQYMVAHIRNRHLDPKVRLPVLGNGAQGFRFTPNPESEPKRPHCAAPQPRSSRAKTCHVSPMLIESDCSTLTAQSVGGMNGRECDA